MSVNTPTLATQELPPPRQLATGRAVAQVGAPLQQLQPADLEDRRAAHLRFRRALTSGYLMWGSFIGIDWMMVHHLDAASFEHMLGLRIAVLVLLFPILALLYRSKPLDPKLMRVLDLFVFSVAGMAISAMCAEFRGLASPYISGLNLVLLARIVTSQDPWQRGAVMSGIPVALFYAVLFGSALFLPSVAAQFHDAAALTHLMLQSAYVLGTYIFLVVGGHVVWSLRREVSEARSLGRYRLRRRLASGGMGEVWVAHHPGLKRDVAVKILRDDLRQASAHAVPRFEREARATAELLHPNTVRVFDYGSTEDGLFYYVMELLEGETLAERVKRVGPLPAAKAMHIIGQAARALGEAHAHGIVHRDIKPENIFLTSLGGEVDFVKVLDFGIAKIKHAVDATVTQTGSLLGTPMYMSPEAVSGQAADARADVYALGAVLYFLLCGKPPFDAHTPIALVMAQVQGPPPLPSVVLGASLPGELEALVMRTLLRDPLERHATGTEFAVALSHCPLS